MSKEPITGRGNMIVVIHDYVCRVAVPVLMLVLPVPYHVPHVLPVTFAPLMVLMYLLHVYLGHMLLWGRTLVLCVQRDIIVRVQ